MMLPQVLLCDGIVGIFNSDNGKRPGGLGSTSHDFRRPFTHPGRFADGAPFEKQSIAGRDYCAAGLEGGGMKRRLVLQPELRELIARLSRHRPVSEKLGRRLSEAEYLGLKAALGRGDVQLVTRFVPGDGEGPVPANTKRRLLVEQCQMVWDKIRAMLRLLEGIELEQAARGGSPRLWQHFPCEWGELLYDLGAHDSDDGIIGHSDGLVVVQELLLGKYAIVEDRRQLGEHSLILRRVLDAQGGLRFPAFFLPALHHLYELTLLARGNTGYGDAERDGWVIASLRPLGRAVELQHLSQERGPLSEAEAVLLAGARTAAQDGLSAVEGLQPNAVQWEAMGELERGLLRSRLGRDEEGDRMHPLPDGHTSKPSRTPSGTTRCRGGNRGGACRDTPPLSTRTDAARPQRSSNAPLDRRSAIGTPRTSRGWSRGKQVGEEEQAPAPKLGGVCFLLSSPRHLRLPFLPPWGEPARRFCGVVHAAGPGGSPQVRRVR
jgi:hypothetical protein